MKSFGAQLRAYAKKHNLRFEKVAAAANIETATNVIKRSPVDGRKNKGGRFKGNWQASVGYPSTGTLEIRDKTGTRTINKMQPKAIAGVGGVFYLTNNLPYARVLEYGEYKGDGPKTTADGYSKQAPRGMVRLSVKEYRTALAKALRETK